MASHPAPQLAMVEPHILFAAEPPVVAAVTTGDAQIMPGSPVAGKATLRYRF